jgi:adenosylcobinamide-GDP ribazoletransferase
MDADGVAQAAEYMPLFPMVGAVVGLIVGVCVWFLELILPQLVSAAVGLGLILLINGAQHMDGLLDFGDGLMFHGSKSGRLRVMRDPTTGAGGFALGIVVFSVTVFAIGAIPSPRIVLSLITSEAAAVFSMVLAAAGGRSAHKGMNTRFVEAMHHRRALRLSVSSMIILVVAFLALRFTGLLVVAGVTITALAMVVMSNRNFGGLTGDVLGATNEIARTVSLLLVLVFANWV